MKPVCENCNIAHDGSYGSGRFCSVTCSRSFSTKTNRQEINAKVKSKLSGRIIGDRADKSKYGRPWSDETRVKIQSKLLANGAILRQRTIEETPFHLLKYQTYQRPIVIEEQNGKCANCSINEWQGKSIALQIDHIDGNNSNNHRENLRALCPNCHSQTMTYAGKNKKRLRLLRSS